MTLLDVLWVSFRSLAFMLAMSCCTLTWPTLHIILCDLLRYTCKVGPRRRFNLLYLFGECDQVVKDLRKLLSIWGQAVKDDVDDLDLPREAREASDHQLRRLTWRQELQRWQLGREHKETGKPSENRNDGLKCTMTRSMATYFLATYFLVLNTHFVTC